MMWNKLNKIESDILEIKEEIKNISSFISKIDSKDYKLNEDLKNLVTNLIANLYINHHG